MKGKKLLAAMSAGLAILAMAGCGGKENAEGGTQTAENTVKEEVKAQSGDAGGQETKLKVLYWESMYTDPLREVAARFEADHPGVTIDLEVPAGDFEAVLNTRLMSDEAPDMFMYYGSSVFKMAQNNYWGTFEDDTEWVGGLKEDFKNAMTYNGKISACPLDCSAEGIFYNKQLFADKGLKVPESYQEFLELCDTLKGEGITPIAIADWGIYHGFSSILVSNQSVKDPGFGDRLYNGEATFTESGYRKSLQIFKELYDKGYINEGALGMDVNQAAQDVISGNSAMLFLSNYATSLFQDIDPDTEIGFFTFPNEEGGSGMVAYVDKAIGYYPEGNHVELSKEFINYLASPDVLSMVVEKINAIPCSENVDAALSPTSQEVFEALGKQEQVFAFFDSYWPKTCNTILDKGLKNILAGSDEVDQILQDMQEAYDADRDTVIAPILPY